MDKRKRILTGTNATIVVALTIVAAVLLNLIVSRYPTTWDLTDDQIYTLSPASVEAVTDLEEPVEVKVFVSPDMPPPFHRLPQQLSDLLTDYAAHSNGQLTYQIIQPSSDDEEAEEAAAGYGIEKVGIGQQTEDEVSLRAVYKGVAFIQGDDIEVIKDLRTTGNPETDNFEYEFTKALLNLRDTEARTVAFVSGFGGPAAAGPQFVQGVQPVFQQLYGDLIAVETVDLSASPPEIPEKVDALVILNAAQPFSDEAKFAIDQFVQKGGSVGWFQSSSVVDQQMMQQLAQQMGGRNMPSIRKPANPGLQDFFGHYGLTHNMDLVLDRKNALALGFVMTQQGLARVSHPATFLMNDIDTTLPFTRNVPALAMPAPASITIAPEAKESEDLDVHEVVKTGPAAVRRKTPPTSLNYQEFVDPKEGEEPGPFVVAAALQGDVPSYYTDNPLPSGVSEEELVQQSKPARVLVVGSGEFFQPMPNVGFNQQLAGMGGQFLLSSIEWLVQDNALTQIRGKNMPRLIGEIPREAQRRIQFTNIALVPLLFIGIGYVIMLIRRRRRRTFEL